MVKKPVEFCWNVVFTDETRLKLTSDWNALVFRQKQQSISSKKKSRMYQLGEDIWCFGVQFEQVDEKC